MTLPYTPTVLPTPIVNPSIGSQGTPPIPYLSNSVFNFAPTAVDGKNLYPGGDPSQNLQALADTIRRASRWADAHCFGADPSGAGVSLAASLSVESVTTRIKGNQLRLICDYRPIIQAVGIDVGTSPADVTSIGPNIAASVRIGRKTIYVPLSGVPVRSGDVGSPVTPAGSGGYLYAVWSYVNGYPHTSLAEGVTEGATTCVVNSTDGNGGVWGVLPGLTRFMVYDQDLTESVLVTDITPGTSTTTLTTSPFANDHTIPVAPDFIPVTTIPEDVQQAVILITSVLIKSRGAKAMVMPRAPGGGPSPQALAQAGATGDWNRARGLLRPYVTHNKSKN